MKSFPCPPFLHEISVTHHLPRRESFPGRDDLGPLTPCEQMLLFGRAVYVRNPSFRRAKAGAFTLSDLHHKGVLEEKHLWSLLEHLAEVRVSRSAGGHHSLVEFVESQRTWKTRLVVESGQGVAWGCGDWVSGNPNVEWFFVAVDRLQRHLSLLGYLHHSRREEALR